MSVEQLDVVEDDVRAVFFIDVPAEDCEQFISHLDDTVSVVSNTVTAPDESESQYEIDIPAVFEALDTRTPFAIESMRSNDVVETGDKVAVVAQVPSLDEPFVGTTTVSDEHMDEELKTLFFESKPSIDTIQKTLDVAISLSQTGQKGEPIGVLLVVGDEEAVMNHSRPLNHNPFSGADVDISDDVVSASIGEFAKLDGAFVISDTGRVVSASRYLEPSVHDAEVPSGLGARHMAASGITTTTDAVSVVVSESDQKLRCFVDGEIVVSASPDEMDILS